ncbi:hypothetical protein JCM9279_000092 [Rhodotorula babjevae]
MQPAAVAPHPPHAPPPAPASSLNPHRLSTQSTQSTASAGSSATNGRLSPASTRLRIDVPSNERFLRSSLNAGPPADKGKARATAADEVGEGRSSPRSSSEYGVVGGGGPEPSRPPTSPAGERGDEEDPPRTPITLPRSPRHAAVIQSQSDEDDESGRDDFHDAHDDWFGGGGALLDNGGVGLGLGIAGPSSLPTWHDEPSSSSPHEQREPSAERKARAHASSGSDEVDAPQRRGSLPFPSRAFAPVPPDLPSYDKAMSTDLPSRPPVASHASRSTTGSHESSVSSTVSVPRTPPVDLVLPNRTLGPYESVANGPMASLAAGNGSVPQRNQPSSSGGGARSFFSNLLHRSPRQHPSPRLGSSSPSSDTSPNPGIPRSPSAPHGWQHPSVASLQSNDAIHARSTSMPLLSNGEPAPRDSSDLYRPTSHGQGASTAHPARRTPRSIAAATFAGLTRSSSLRVTSSSPRLGGGGTTATPPSAAASPVPTFDFTTPPLPSTASAAATAPEPEPPSLSSIGLSLVPLTQPLPLSRSGQPLCGAVLDGRYLLIGTTIGLDFLPLPVPGSLPMQHLGNGGKKRKDTRKPISLIKRTRFKELAILSERSNILLAIAGRNDHIRVYALDGIRAMIEKKMQEVDARDGYPLAVAKPIKLRNGLKGKERARTTSDSLAPPLPVPPPAPQASSQATSASYQFPPTSTASATGAAAPADLSTPRPRESAASSSTARRRPSSWHQAVNATSPIRISRQPSLGSIVRAVPTNPSATRSTDSGRSSNIKSAGAPTVRSQKSREFVAGRRGSSASIPRRLSRADLDTLADSRRTSAYSVHSRRGSAWPASEVAGGSGASTSARRASVAAVPRLPAAASSADGQRRDSSTHTAASASAAKRMQPRPPAKAQQAPLERSPTSDLADFLRDSGPEMRSPEMDNVLASVRGRRRSSVAENVLNTAPGAQLFPAGSASSRSLFSQSQAAAQLAGLALYTMSDKGDVVEMLREPPMVGGGPCAPADALVPPPLPPKHEARDPTTPRLGAGQPSPSMELAALLRDTAPDEPDEARGGEGAAAAATAAREAALERLEARSAGDNSSSPDELRGGSPTVPGAVGGSPSSRASKRWTMSALGSKLLSRPAPAAEDPSTERAESSSSLGRRASAGQWEMVPDAQSLPQPARPAPVAAPDLAHPAPPTSRPTTSDRKRRPAASLHRESAPSIAPSSQAPPDAHPASSSSPLEYVKLARTKGARMLRAVETKKRTYLAVLSGEEAERIELFTGSRSISLSLNRTFVLPETPRSIEFQLQGDDLVDIYLVYPESIFALEPSTVRVREVGVGRGERRARRERDRQLRTLATAASEALPAEGVEEAAPAELQSTLHPADHERQEQARPAAPASDAVEVDDVAVPLDPARRSPSPSPAPSPRPDGAQPPATPPPGYDIPPRPRTQSSVSSPAHEPPFERTQPSSTSQPSRGKLPYSTFQQLPFVPPVPSSTLSSAWTIPPLYSDVVGGSPPPPSSSDDEDLLGPSITVTSTSGVDGAVCARTGAPPVPPPHGGLDIPLLSPVSLLGGAAIRHNGPPGLFFVSKGSSISGIVTADGKSIIKRPLIWSSDQAPASPDSECLQRLEVLVVGGTRTVVVKLSSTDVKAISVDGGSSSFSTAVPVTRSNARGQVNFLSTHRVGQQLLFAQTVGPSTTIFCLAPSRA